MTEQFLYPEPFLSVRVHDLDCNPNLTALCAGYEQGYWRSNRLADHLIEWLPEFALSYSEWSLLQSNNAIEKIRKAAKSIYTTDKYEKRGEFGELLLHAIIRQVCKTIPAISKIYYKDSHNNTVKGFDSVHVVVEEDRFELWLGEAKLYNEIDSAINSVVDEINTHLEVDYLRKEFCLISNKIDINFPYADKLKKLLHDNTSLDLIFNCTCIPVLLTYDSDSIKKHISCTDDYVKDFKEEIMENYQKFKRRSLPKEIRIHLFLVPLHSKKMLVTHLHEKLRSWQKL